MKYKVRDLTNNIVYEFESKYDIKLFLKFVDLEHFESWYACVLKK